mgnify:CR=1 FL=1
MRGRPRKPVDTTLVEKLAAHGLADHEIADVLGISERTIQRRCRVALDRGRAKLKVSLRRWQIRAAKRGNVTMLIWLGKQYLGQRDPPAATEGETVHVVERIVFPTTPQEP